MPTSSHLIMDRRASGSHLCPLDNTFKAFTDQPKPGSSEIWHQDIVAGFGPIFILPSSESSTETPTYETYSELPECSDEMALEYPSLSSCSSQSPFEIHGNVADWITSTELPDWWSETAFLLDAGSFETTPSNTNSPFDTSSPSSTTALEEESTIIKPQLQCPYPNCRSRTTFTRQCDLRKHLKRHFTAFFCRHTSCPRSTKHGFSTKKDRERHEAKHDPKIGCEWEGKGCNRVFSRMDNMKDHVKRVHLKTRPQ